MLFRALVNPFTSSRTWLVLGFWGSVAGVPLSACPPQISSPVSAYDVVWRTPSADASGSMPLGNGEVGVNVWVNPAGEVHLYVSRTDSFSEASRLLKLGEVVVSVRAPQPDEFFQQRLHLAEGWVSITLGEGERRVALKLWVDSAEDVIYVTGEAERETPFVVSARSWRTQERRLTGEELKSSWTMQGAPESVHVLESADLPLRSEATRATPVGFFHWNRTSVVPLTLAHQGLSADASTCPDPLLHRMFGLGLDVVGENVGPGHVRSELAPVLLAHRKRLSVRIAAPCCQSSDEGAFRERVTELLGKSDDQASGARTAASWQGFWSRSWVFAQEGPTGGGPGPGETPQPDSSPASRLTQALILQRWVQACGGRGAYPIKFNGSIFTVEPALTGGAPFDADWRRWGDAYWWQNTRLPYHAMLPQGDFEMMEPLFRLYERALPLARARAKRWHDVDGAWIPETMTAFGTYANNDYGWDRTGHEPHEVLCPWWCYAWNQGPELLALMLDRHGYQPSPEFVEERLLPMADAVLDYFISRFPRDEGGRLKLTPTQSAETYWYGVENDLPTVAGLHEVLERLLALPMGILGEVRHQRWRAFRDILPPIPVREFDGVRRLSPAERFDPKRSNCENPELYAIWPFRRYGLGRPDLEVARQSYFHRHEKMTQGWTQDGQQAALLGLVEEARANVLAKLGNTHAGHRFPVMWGPNFDWLPDQCHGSNLLNTVHAMLLQPVGDRLLVLPAWPLDWRVGFRLRAPGGVVVDVEYRDGEVHRLDVTPAPQRERVALPAALSEEAARLGLSTFER